MHAPEHEVRDILTSENEKFNLWYIICVLNIFAIMGNMACFQVHLWAYLGFVDILALYEIRFDEEDSDNR